MIVKTRYIEAKRVKGQIRVKLFNQQSGQLFNHDYTQTIFVESSRFLKILNSFRSLDSWREASEFFRVLQLGSKN